MDKKLTGIIAYLTLIGWLIAFLCGDKKGAKFHLNQALVLAIAEIILGALSGVLVWILIIGPIISSVLSILLFVLWLIGIIGAIKGENKAVPLLGRIQIL